VHDVNAWVDIFGLHCNKKTSYNGKSRRDAFRQAKRDAGIPIAQQPSRVNKVDLDDGFGNKIHYKKENLIQTREYLFTNNKGEDIIIQEHSVGHTNATSGHGKEPHFNVRPVDNPRAGHVDGTHGHYNF
jgi:hypothetical protein